MILAKDFSYLYNVSMSNIYVAKHTNHEFVYKQGSKLYVDTKPLLARRKHRDTVIKASQDNYGLITSHIKEYELARLLNKAYPDTSLTAWNTYMRTFVFKVRERDSALTYKVPKQLWKFYRFTTHYIKEQGYT